MEVVVVNVLSEVIVVSLPSDVVSVIVVVAGRLFCLWSIPCRQKAAFQNCCLSSLLLEVVFGNLVCNRCCWKLCFGALSVIVVVGRCIVELLSVTIVVGSCVLEPCL